MSANTSRKPSESSSHSRAHSPSSENVRGANVASTYKNGPVGHGNNSLNSGWQLWTSSLPKDAVAPVKEVPPSPEDTGVRTVRDGWTASRTSVRGTWDEVDERGQMLNTATRMRQGIPPQLAGPLGNNERLDMMHNYEQYSYQPKSPSVNEYGSAYVVSARPSFSGQPDVTQGHSLPGTTEAYRNPSDDHSLVIRGMAVEDESGVHDQQPLQVSHPPPQNASQSPNTFYPQADYRIYPVPDYSFGYGEYRNPGEVPIFPSQVVGNNPPSFYMGVPPRTFQALDLQGQPPAFLYDYIATPLPHNSQFYFPSQTLPFPQPIQTSVVNNAMSMNNPPVPPNKKFEYGLRQPLHQNQQYGQIRSLSNSPLPHQYPMGMSCEPQAQVIVPSLQDMQRARSLRTTPPNGKRPGRRLLLEASDIKRSQLLDDFRANRGKKLEIKDVFGYIVEFSNDQYGSRFIQQQLESATAEERQIIFDEIVPKHTLPLIQGVFGNYVIQKLFEYGTQEQRDILVSNMQGYILSLSLQMYGCRVIQKAIEFVTPEQHKSFILELDPHVLHCVKDANGNHVIQKLIEWVSSEHLCFISSFRGNIYNLSTHPYGCRVLQRTLEHLPEDQVQPLMEEFHRCATSLTRDQFGNYVVQYVIEHGKPADRELVISKLRGQFLQMARHKFASNVCEQALTFADFETRRALIDEILTSKHNGVNTILTMMRDQFANYVLQKAMLLAEGDQKEALFNQVKPQLVNIRRYSGAYNKHLNSIERLLRKQPDTQTQTQV